MATPAVASPHQSPPDEHFLRVPEVAAWLRLSTSRIYELTSAEAIPFRQFRPGGRCLFLASEIEQWMLGAQLETFRQNGCKAVRICPRNANGATPTEAPSTELQRIAGADSDRL